MKPCIGPTAFPSSTRRLLSQKERQPSFCWASHLPVVSQSLYAGLPRPQAKQVNSVTLES